MSLTLSSKSSASLAWDAGVGGASVGVFTANCDFGNDGIVGPQEEDAFWLKVEWIEILPSGIDN